MTLVQTHSSRRLRHSYMLAYQCLSAAAHVTHQSFSSAVHWHHVSSSEHCCIVFQIL